MPNLDDILRDALELDTEQRAALAERLLASLDRLSERDAEKLWAEEAQRRRNEFRAGRAGTIDAADVHEKAAKLLG